MDILDIALKAKLTNGKNKILNASLNKKYNEDKVIKQITRELAELVINITKTKSKKKS